MSFITWKILREFITNYTELATLQFGSGLRCNVFLGAKILQVTWNYAFIISLEKIPGFADVMPNHSKRRDMVVTRQLPESDAIDLGAISQSLIPDMAMDGVIRAIYQPNIYLLDVGSVWSPRTLGCCQPNFSPTRAK